MLCKLQLRRTTFYIFIVKNQNVGLRSRLWGRVKKLESPKGLMAIKVGSFIPLMLFIYLFIYSLRGSLVATHYASICWLFLNNRKEHQFHSKAKHNFNTEVSDASWAYIPYCDCGWHCTRSYKVFVLFCVHLKQQARDLLPEDCHLTHHSYKSSDITRKTYYQGF